MGAGYGRSSPFMEGKGLSLGPFKMEEDSRELISGIWETCLG
jgi:hypothetical protein